MFELHSIGLWHVKDKEENNLKLGKKMIVMKSK